MVSLAPILNISPENNRKLGVPFILQKSHIKDFMKEILRKEIFSGKKYIDLVTSKFIFKMSFLSISFIKSNL